MEGESIEAMSTEQRIGRIASFINSSPAALFHENFVDSCYKSLKHFCDDFLLVLNDVIISKPLMHQLFVVQLIPKIVEILIRKRISKEHERLVSSILLKVIHLLSDELYVAVISGIKNDLYELRCYLLSDSFISVPSFQLPFKFLTPKSLNLINPNTGLYITSFCQHGTFFQEHGKPVCIVQLYGDVYIWPDEWDKTLNGFNARGHYIKLFIHDNWVEGIVTDYNEETMLYCIILDQVSKGTVTYDEGKDILNIKIQDYIHQWSDSTNRYRVLSESSNVNNLAYDSNLLRFDHSDEGKFIRIWWDRYQQYYYGRIISYDKDSAQHSICYEDGDIRSYDMRTKRYELLHVIPDDILIQLQSCKSDQQSAQIVSKWHNSRVNDSTSSSSNSVETGDLASFGISDGSDVCLRPPPSANTVMSYHHCILVNEYFKLNSTDNIYTYLTSSDTPGSTKSISYYVKLVAVLRGSVKPSIFRGLVWEVKEATSFAFNKYDSICHPQLFKNFKLEEFNSICCELRQLIAICNPVSPMLKTDEEIEWMRLNFANKLLKCSTIQKRFLGLSLIKVAIELLSPATTSILQKCRSELGTIMNAGSSKEVAKYNFPMANQTGYKSSSSGSISVTLFIKWLLDNSILEAIYCTSFHQDLAMNSDVILIFLGQNDQLNNSHIELIWNATLKAHEVERRVIFQVLLTIITSISDSNCYFMYTLLETVPMDDYNEQFLHFLKQFTTQYLRRRHLKSLSEYDRDLSSHSIDESNKLNAKSRRGVTIALSTKPWMGFTLLWRYIHTREIEPDDAKMDHNNNVNLVNLATTLIVELLDESYPDEKEDIINSCIKNISNNNSVTTSLRVLRYTLASYPSESTSAMYKISTSVMNRVGVNNNGNTTVQTFIDTLNRQYHLLDTFFKNLAEQNSYELKSIQEKLEFLKFIISKSNLVLQGKYALLLWKKFGEEMIKVGNLEVFKYFLEWLDNMIVVNYKDILILLTFLKQESDPYNDDKVSVLANLSIPDITVHDIHIKSSKLTEYAHCSVFDDTVVLQLLNVYILPFACAADNVFLLSNKSIGLCFIKFFIYVNILSSSLKLDNNILSGNWGQSLTDKTYLPWVRVGNLSSVSILWKLAVDSVDQTVKDVAMHLLVEIHHRFPQKYRQAENCRNSFMTTCFNQLHILLDLIRDKDSSAQRISSVDENNNAMVNDSTAMYNAANNENVMDSDYQNINLDGDEVIFDSFGTSSPRRRSSSSNKVASTPLGLSSTRNSSDNSLSKSNSSIDLGHIPITDGDHSLYITAGTTPQRTMKHDFFDNEQLLDPKEVFIRLQRFISLLNLYMNRFLCIPTMLCNISIVVGKDDCVSINFNLPSSAKIATIRQLVATHFKEAPNVIQLVKISKSLSILGNILPDMQNVLNDDEVNLIDSQFTLLESISASKKEDNLPVVAVAEPINKSTAVKAIVRDDSDDSIKKSFLISDQQESIAFYLLDWLESPRKTAEINLTFKLPVIPHCSIQKRAASPSNASKKLVPALKAEMLSFFTLYVQQYPVHLDQLLEMLDGYFVQLVNDDSSNDVRSYFNFDDICAAVWNILALIPVANNQLFLQIKDMISDNSGVMVRQLLNISNPYRLLYSLLHLEAWLNGDHIFSDITSMTWSNEFIFIGGVEHVVFLIEALIRKIQLISDTANCASSNCFKKENIKMHTNVRLLDAYIMSLALLFRFLHRLVSHDPLYGEYNEVYDKEKPPSRDQINSNLLPPGIVLSTLQENVKCFFGSALDMIHSLSVAASNGVQTSATQVQNMFDSFSFQIIVENFLVLFNGLLCAIDDSISLFNQFYSTDKFVLWLQQMLIFTPDSYCRYGVCRRIFDGCANIWLLCGNGDIAQEKKPGKLKLFDYIYFNLALAIGYNSGSAPTKCNNLGGCMENIYSLLAAIHLLKMCPELLFQSKISTKPLIKSKIMKIISSPFPEKENLEDGVVDGRNRIVNDSQQYEISPNILCQLFIQKLLDYSPADDSSEAQDGTLIGILRLLLSLNSNKVVYQEIVDSNIMSYLYLTLYPSTNNNKVRYVNGLADFVGNSTYKTEDKSSDMVNNREICQSRESKMLAYGLLSQLCKVDSQNLVDLLHIIDSTLESHFNLIHGNSNNSNFDGPARCTRWDYNPNVLSKEADIYVGLVNQGCTCYMNSFLQQLYFTPGISEGILGVDPESLVDSSSSSNNIKMFIELQNLFGGLKYSHLKFVDTLSLCTSMIGYEGRPISLVEQQDVNEFAGMLFDKLEDIPMVKQALYSNLKGKLVRKTMSLETDYKSEQEETFYMLTAEVKNKASIEESLELLVAEEKFSGENQIEDTIANKKVDGVRFCAIKVLPHTLIIHLKRFEFDMETGNSRKVNDRITFPTELDMFPYTEDGKEALKSIGGRINNQDCVYTLRGVIAHVGSIDRGHYYSFIRDPQQNWYEFNDRIVNRFSADNLSYECFGGDDINARSGDDGAVKRKRQHNAYMLFYERKVTIGNTGLAANRPIDNVSKSLLNKIYKENNEYFIDRCIFDPCQARFIFQLTTSQAINELISSVDSTNNESTINTITKLVLVAFRYVVDVIFHAKASSCLPLFLERLEEIISSDSTKKCAQAIIDYLCQASTHSSGNKQSVHKYLVSIYTNCPNNQAIKGFTKLILCCLRTVRPLHEHIYLHTYNTQVDSISTTAASNTGITPSITDHKRSQGDKSISSVSKFINELLSVTELMRAENAMLNHGYQQVTSILLQFAYFGIEERILLISLGSIYRIICSILTLNPSVTKLSRDECRNSTDLLAFLIRTSVIPNRNYAPVQQLNYNQVFASLKSLNEQDGLALSPFLHPDSIQHLNSKSNNESHGELPILCDDDVYAMQNRIFLDEAVLTESNLNIFSALQHICWSRGNVETIKILEYFSEKLGDCCMVNGTTGIMQEYRVYFRAVSDILLGPAIDPVLVFEKIIPSLLDKAMMLAERLHGKDPEFIYSVFKLLHRVGTSNESSHACVVSIRNMVRTTRNKFSLSVGKSTHLSNSTTASSDAVMTNASLFYT